jgi:hypothetical protein
MPHQFNADAACAGHDDEGTPSIHLSLPAVCHKVRETVPSTTRARIRSIQNETKPHPSGDSLKKQLPGQPPAMLTEPA